MVWFKVDDNLHSHPKIRRAGFAATGLWIMAGAYAAQYSTDGWVPKWFVTGQRGGTRLAKILVDVGLWEPAQRDGEDGWAFHDWDDYQPTAADVDAEKAANRERQRRFRERKRAEREAARNATRNGVSNAPPTRPVPGVSPDGDTPPTRRNNGRNAVTSPVTPTVTNGGGEAAESAPSSGIPDLQNTPAVLASHGLARHEQRDFLAHLRATNATSPNALVSHLHRNGQLAGRIDEWRLSAEADAQAAAAPTPRPPTDRQGLLLQAELERARAHDAKKSNVLHLPPTGSTP